MFYGNTTPAEEHCDLNLSVPTATISFKFKFNSLTIFAVWKKIKFEISKIYVLGS